MYAMKMSQYHYYVLGVENNIDPIVLKHNMHFVNETLQTFILYFEGYVCNIPCINTNTNIQYINQQSILCCVHF